MYVRISKRIKTHINMLPPFRFRVSVTHAPPPSAVDVLTRANRILEMPQRLLDNNLKRIKIREA